jgi:hypothetical protein
VNDDRLTLWKCVVDDKHAALRAAAAEVDPARVQDVERLRRSWPAELVSIALELARARANARSKFPEAGTMYADPVGVEMASSAEVAQHKAGRFDVAGTARVLDLCCGIGGDAMALCRRPCDVHAYDHDPIRAWMCAHNAGCEASTADVTMLDVRDAWVHLDPSRRTGQGRRVQTIDDFEPGRGYIERCLHEARGAAVKLGPGVDIEDLRRPSASEVEFISERGTLVQAVVWSRELVRAAGCVTATQCPAGLSFTGTPQLDVPLWHDDAPGQHVYVADPALERSGTSMETPGSLLGAFAKSMDLYEMHPGLGLLTSNESIESLWLRRYDVRAAMSWKEKRVRAWLREHDAGEVTIKTRARVVDPDVWSTRLTGSGGTPYVVFIVRLGLRNVAWITDRPTASL